MVEAFLFFWGGARGGGIDDSGNRLTLIKQGVCHTVALPFTLKKYLKAKGE